MADDAQVIQNGIYRFNDKWKQRGLGKLNGKEIEHLDTFEKDGRLYYRSNMLKNNRLRSSIRQDKIQEIGKIKSITREFNLNADRKRLWFDELRDVNDGRMIDSMPISMSFVDWKRQIYKESK